MLFQFGLHSSLLLPFVVPGAVATLWLLVRAARRGSSADALLALLLLVPTLSVSQWMLGYAGWFDSHDSHSTIMFYVPWRANLLLGGAYYLYFRSLTNQDFRWRPALKHLLPGLLEWALFAAVAAYDLLWWRGLRGRPLPDFFGTKGAAATALDELALPQALLSAALLLWYGRRMRAEYHRYRHYLNDNFSDPERLRFAGLRQLLGLQTLVLVLSLLFTVLNQVYDFSYDTAWYFFALRGVLIYGLIAVGIQANYAAATSSLRFGAEVPSDEPAASPLVTDPLLARRLADARDEASGPGAIPAAAMATFLEAVATGNESNTQGTLAAAETTDFFRTKEAPTALAASKAAAAFPQHETAASSAAAALASNSAAGALAANGASEPVTDGMAASLGADGAAALGGAAGSAGAFGATAVTTFGSTAPALPAAPAAGAALPAELQPWRARLLRLMDEEQPWLEPELTLTELAHRLRTNPALLSKVINAGCGQNFNDFVNTYRVHEARRKLADARFAHYSLVGVALESGFNSKSTFNRVFQKLLGQAPSAVMRPKS